MIEVVFNYNGQTFIGVEIPNILHFLDALNDEWEQAVQYGNKLTYIEVRFDETEDE